MSSLKAQGTKAFIWDFSGKMAMHGMGFVVSIFYNNQKLIPLTQVISFSFVIGAFSAVQNTKLRKELNYALLTKVGFVASLLSGVVGISLALILL